MNQLDALRNHALFVNDGSFQRLLVETARHALSSSSLAVLELPRDAACTRSSNASRLANSCNAGVIRACYVKLLVVSLTSHSTLVSHDRPPAI